MKVGRRGIFFFFFFRRIHKSHSIEGAWENGKMHGTGVDYFANGRVYRTGKRSGGLKSFTHRTLTAMLRNVEK